MRGPFFLRFWGRALLCSVGRDWGRAIDKKGLKFGQGAEFNGASSSSTACSSPQPSLFFPASGCFSESARSSRRGGAKQEGGAKAEDASSKNFPKNGHEERRICEGGREEATMSNSKHFPSAAPSRRHSGPVPTNRFESPLTDLQGPIELWRRHTRFERCYLVGNSGRRFGTDAEHRHLGEDQYQSERYR